jgi:hypothetical protein
MNTPFQLGPPPRLAPNLAATLPLTGGAAGPSGWRRRRPARRGQRDVGRRRLGPARALSGLPRGSSASIGSGLNGGTAGLTGALALRAPAVRVRLSALARPARARRLPPWPWPWRGRRPALPGASSRRRRRFGLFLDQLGQLVDQAAHALLVALEALPASLRWAPACATGCPAGGAARLFLFQHGFLVALFLRDLFQFVLGVLGLGLVLSTAARLARSAASRRACACDT